MAREWSVIAKLIEDPDRSGVGVFLSNGERYDDIEIAAVGFVRVNTENPALDFQDAFEVSWKRGQDAAEVINEGLDEFERLEAQRATDLRDRVAEIIDGPRAPQ